MGRERGSGDRDKERGEMSRERKRDSVCVRERERNGRLVM